MNAIKNEMAAEGGGQVVTEVGPQHPMSQPLSPGSAFPPGLGQSPGFPQVAAGALQEIHFSRQQFHL